MSVEPGPSAAEDLRRLDGASLTVGDVVAVARRHARVAMTSRAWERNADAHALATKLLEQGVAIYGRNTGVGALMTAPADAEDAEHSLRLLRSHAGGTGELVEAEVARAMLTVRANQFGVGGAGVDKGLIEAMLAALNDGLAPAVRELGSIGTGDLTSLAEAGLALLGEGAWLGGSGGSPQPLWLRPTDALALLSSNARTVGEAALACADARTLVRAAETVAALSFAAVDGNPAAYHERVGTFRPHRGQLAAASHMRELVGAAPGPTGRLQDPLCYRCVPQVQGAARDAVAALEQVLVVELNAASENPVLASDEGVVLHNGNFHEAHLALALDQTRGALVQAGSQASQRLATLLDPELTGLPSFLAADSSSSGAMILEYTAHAALDELRATASPVTLANAALSHSVENHASFAALGTRQLARALRRYTSVVAAELVAAVRALRMSDRTLPTAAGRAARDRATEVMPADLTDRPLSDDLEIAAGLLGSGGLE